MARNITNPARLKTPPAPNCASGTAHNTGEAIHRAVLQQQGRELQAAARKTRRARSPDVWQLMYAEAMAEKRARIGVGPGQDQKAATKAETAQGEA